MGLGDILCDVVDRVSGARLVGVIGTDGVSIEMMMDEDYVPHDYRAAELELAWLAATASITANRLGIGNVYDLTMETDDLTYLFSLITHGYYAVLGVVPESDLGGARSAIHQMADRCRVEL
ncbi:MAG: hypothetical protein HC884_07845 [Chloroflexaceae bacterium]|nr:hypothetical protein [Chloroflexaceae bacterium]